MLKKKQKAIFLDWAGTITDFLNFFYKIYKNVAKEINQKPKSKSQVKKDFTVPYMKFWNLHFPNLTKQHQDKLYQKFIKQLPLTSPLPNVKNTIAKLTKSGWMFFVTSSDPYERIVAEAKQIGIYNYITETASGLHDKIPAIKRLIKKYNVDAKNSFYIGDTIGDVEMGKKSELKTIAVTTGMNTTKRLKSSQPDYLINDFKKILKIANL